MVYYLHEIPVKSPSVHTSSVTSVITPVHALSIPSIHPSDDKCQEILDKFPCINYGEKFLSDITVKIPDDITLTLHLVKFRENPW